MTKRTVKRATKRVTKAEGIAALEAAEMTLAPLFGPVTQGDVVHRVLPPTETGDNPQVALSRAIFDLRLLYSPEKRALIRELKMWCPPVMVGGPATVAFGYILGEGSTGNSTLGFTLIFVLGMAASILGYGIPVVTVAERVGHKRGGTIARAIATIEVADLSGMVEVINPDPSTALALDRAQTHASKAHADIKAIAYQHYYDFASEVVNGSAGTSAGTRTEQWATAWQKWCQVDDAWTDLMCDPLAALDHSELLDVTLPRTAAFINAYAEAKDAMLGRTAAITPADLTRLLRLVETTHTTWVEAHAHAQHAGYAWLPEAEAKKATTAASLLRLAADETAPMAERANAATKASRLLTQITTVRLPDKARTELDSLARKALPVAAMTPILITEPDVAESSTILAQARETVPA